MKLPLKKTTQNILKYTKLIIVLYIALTITEWVIHKYIMHNRAGVIINRIYGKTHLNYHKKIDNELQLDSDSPLSIIFMDAIAFLIMLISIFILFNIIINHLDIPLFRFKLDLNTLTILKISLGITFFYKFIRDYLHYKIHNIPTLFNIPIPRRYLKWVTHRQRLHHLHSGNGNFNILVPGGDIIFNDNI